MQEFTQEEIEDRCEIGQLTSIPTRFFMYCWRLEELDGETVQELDTVECTEPEFLAAEGVIEYKRFTTFSNGASFIALTKNPEA